MSRVFSRLVVASVLAMVLMPSRAQDLCAEVKIEILQEVTLERQAFDAHMRINNGLDDQALENVQVDIVIQDESGVSVVHTSDPSNTSASFFLRLDDQENIDLTSQPAGVTPSTSADIHWLMIPAPGAAGSSPLGKRYSVGATLRYTLAGVEEVVEVSPDFIQVRPMPLLSLDYFLTQYIEGDNPSTTQIESSVPFTLGVRVRNNGLGLAKSVKIESAQPRIVENEQGLLIDFTITGAAVNDGPVSPSLLANLGDIDPNDASMARWDMVSSLAGEFVSFEASFIHADELGGELTSLITDATTHFLVRNVLVDLPGRDAVRDFLGKDGDTLRVYESNGVDTEVTDQSAFAELTFLGNVGPDRQYSITAPDTAGAFYVKFQDPTNGGWMITRAERSDGKVLSLANAWQSVRRRDPNPHSLHVFDTNTSGDYTLTFTQAINVPQPPVLGFIADQVTHENKQIAFLIEATDPNGTPVTFSAQPMPAGATLEVESPGVAVFDWTPTEGQAGFYPITFIASDGELQSSRTATIRVNPAWDTDGDGMDDNWEMQHFGTLDRDGTGDFDGDGISDLDEYLNGTDPTVPDFPANLIVLGQATVDQAWRTVPIDGGLIPPVVITGPASSNDPAPGVVRVDTVAADGFRLRYESWPYLGAGAHGVEAVDYLAVLPGRYALPDGAVFEVGRFDLSGVNTWKDLSFTQPFAARPTLFLTVQTATDADPVTVRARSVNNAGFSAALFEQEGASGHGIETVGYFAFYQPNQSGSVSLGGQTVDYRAWITQLGSAPQVLEGHTLWLQEDAANDAETVHTTETVSVLAVGEAVFAQVMSLNELDTAVPRREGPTDSDGDGMPDAWELLYGLDPNDPSDAAGNLDDDGFTNLEEYQNGTDPTVPDEIVELIIDTSGLPSGRVGVPYSGQMSVTGGTAPYLWSVEGGVALPAGLSLDAATGVISGTPQSAGGEGKFTVGVTDSMGVFAEATAVIFIQSADAPLIEGTLGNGVVGQPYSAQLTVSGGTAPFEWLVSDGTLPPGLVLDSVTGTVSGAPNAAGTYPFSISVLDDLSQSHTASFAVTITEVEVPVISGAPGSGQVGTAYSAQLTVTGGEAPYVWSVIAGALPDGLSLEAGTGLISGMPIVDGSFEATVQVEDANTATDTLVVAITIAPAPQPPEISGTPASGQVGEAYSQSLTVTGGQAPYTWSVTAGSLPTGLTLGASDGVIAGVPESVGVFMATVQVTDANDATDTAEVSITIAAVSVPVIGGEVVQGRVGEAYSVQLTVSGGSAPYQWSTSAGQLPDGLSLDAGTGAITGTPGTAGDFAATIQVTDAVNATGELPVTITVQPAIEPLTIAGEPGDGQVGEVYSAAFTASGGTPPYVWSVSAGSLPDGLSLDAGTGALDGTPTVAGDFAFTVRVTDADEATDEVAVVVTIAPEPEPLVITGEPGGGQVDAAYSTQFTATGGTAPYTWSVIAGSLPPGLTLDAEAGLITGTPTTAGAFSATVQVADSLEATATLAVEIDIDPATPPWRYTVLDPRFGIDPVRLYSLDGAQTVTVNGQPFSLGADTVVTLPAGTVMQGTVLEGAGPFTLGTDTVDTDLPVPGSFAGTAFVIPHARQGHEYYLASVNGAASVQVTTAAGTQTVSVPAGQVVRVDGGVDNVVAARITADVPILVMHRGLKNGVPQDVFPVPPAGTALLGSRNSNVVVAALENGTQVTVVADNGQSQLFSLQAGEQAQVTIGTDARHGEGSALRITADKPVFAIQFGDGDGAEATAFLGPDRWGARYRLPQAAQYAIVVCTGGATAVRWSSPQGDETTLCASTADGVGKVLLVNDGDGALLPAGTRIDASAPVYVSYESAGDDEHNLVGGPATIDGPSQLRITTLAPESVELGETFTMEVRVVNDGLLPEPVTLVVTPGEDVTLVFAGEPSSSFDAPASCPLDGSATCQLASIPPGGNRRVVLQAVANGGSSAQLLLSATPSGRIEDRVDEVVDIPIGDNGGEPPVSTLHMGVSAPSSVPAGSTFQVDVVVRNDNPTAEHVTFTMVVGGTGGGESVLYAIASGGPEDVDATCAVTNRVVCGLGNLQPAEQRTVMLYLTAGGLDAQLMLTTTGASAPSAPVQEVVDIVVVPMDGDG